jgi:hypothetical protein
MAPRYDAPSASRYGQFRIHAQKKDGMEQLSEGEVV